MTHAPFVAAPGGRFSYTASGQVAMILELARCPSWSKPVLVACDYQHRLVSGFSSSFARSETPFLCLSPASAMSLVYTVGFGRGSLDTAGSYATGFGHATDSGTPLIWAHHRPWPVSGLPCLRTQTLWAGYFHFWGSCPCLRLSPLLPRRALSRLSAPFCQHTSRWHTSGMARRFGAPEALRLPGADRKRESGTRTGNENRELEPGPCLRKASCQPLATLLPLSLQPRANRWTKAKLSNVSFTPTA